MKSLMNDIQLTITLTNNMLLSLNDEIGVLNVKKNNLIKTLNSKECFGLVAKQVEEQINATISQIKVLEVYKRYLENKLNDLQEKKAKLLKQEKEAKKRQFKVIK